MPEYLCKQFNNYGSKLKKEILEFINVDGGGILIYY